ncbi:Conserved_hypothetical protein [Hexamita inflata]|uniref:Tetratricopeptide repeat protein n=1 Tax=Hexamita inflata TaxID=28002 RepID=A0AA86VSS6_9EUKA|nr:Conserved hypothetical protein [Hexamita inflata]
MNFKQIPSLIEKGEFAEAITISLYILQNQPLESKQRYFIYLCIVECYIRLKDFQLAAKNMEAISQLAHPSKQMQLCYVQYQILIGHYSENVDSSLFKQFSAIFTDIETEYCKSQGLKTATDLLQSSIKQHYQWLLSKQVEMLLIQSCYSDEEQLLTDALKILNNCDNLQLTIITKLRIIQLSFDHADLPQYENLISTLITNFPHNNNILELLANLTLFYIKFQDFKNAEETLTSAQNLSLKQNGDKSNEFSELKVIEALLLFVQGEFSASLAILNMYQIDSPMYYNLKANNMFNMGQFDEARLLYQQIEHQPGYILSSMKLFDFQNAFTTLDKLLYEEEKNKFQSPRAARILNIAGIVFQLQGKINQAEKLFRQALEIKADPIITFNLGYLLYIKQDVEGASILLRRSRTVEDINIFKLSTRALIMLYNETYKRTKKNIYKEECEILAKDLQDEGNQMLKGLSW